MIADAGHRHAGKLRIRSKETFFSRQNELNRPKDVEKNLVKL